MSALDTHHLLAQIDSIATEIPTIITYLAQSLATLRDIDPARGEIWIRNLAGLSGQYYGRLDRIQTTLRRVVRALRERNASPYAIRPPLPGTALPRAFTSATSPPDTQPPSSGPQDDRPTVSTGEESQPAANQSTAEEEGLSTYAIRLEVAALRDLHDALREMQSEVMSADEERGMAVG